ncbi:MAG: electron transport complex subunit RsxC [Clostridium sp.]|nr:electron transport complex subunit RsxC [Clostridium sp.]MCM1170585.1 electron transport complex subunit RsxC [Clostridium sp.]MCM1207292.1 electron transport complex subunit RsxC [Ruminococcus sp.]
MKYTFKGGIHPYEGKELTMDKEIVEYLPKGDMVYPISQHIGAPAKPIVKKGDRVLAGQLIAEAGGFVSANIHSSVSGTVKAIEARLTSSGSKVNSIIIENDNKYEAVEFTPITKPVSELKKEEILEAVKAAGVVGMGGAGFPTNVKLSPKNADEIDRIIVNASECEPYLTSDYRRLMEQPENIIEGLRIVLRLFKGSKGIIAVEDNKPEAIKLLREKLGADDDITVHSMKTKYPEGAERQLIYANTGRYINSKMLPADVGCIVHNVDTIYSIYEAVREGKPLITRIVTVSGDAIENPCNFKVRTGTSYAELVEAAGGFKGTPAKIISGGPMMGKAIYSLELPVTKSSSAILCLSKDEASEYEPSACIRCGRCVSVCPGRVMPNQLARLANAGDIDAFVKNNGMECCECGCCSYICPAKRPLTQVIAGTRKLVLANKKK